jgi:hypothetical protein
MIASIFFLELNQLGTWSWKELGPGGHVSPIPQNTTQKSISFVFCVSAIRHDSSLSKYRKQKQSPPWTCAILSISRGDCFCLRYLLSDES